MTWHIQNSTPSTSSREPEAAFSVTSYLDTIQSARAKSNPTHVTSCSPDSVTDTCQTSPSGTTWQPSTEIPGADQLTFFAGDSHAKTSVRQVKEQELPANVRDYGRNIRDSLERCGLDLSLPKTHHCFGLGDLELCSKTWPRWGIMLDGELSELGLSVRRTSATECGSWPTPTCQETEHPKAMLTKTGRRLSKNGKTSHSLNLADSVKMWPTPTVAEATKIGAQANYGQVGLNNHPRIRGLPTRPKGEKSRVGGTQTQQSYPTPKVKGQEHYDTVEKRKGKSAATRHNTLASVQVKHHKGQRTAQLNPPWVEWLMGWPIGWTDLKPLVTDKFRSVQQWHSQFSQKDYSETTPITNDINSGVSHLT